MMVRIGLVGCGRNARDIHLPVWKSLSDAQLIGIFDLNKELMEKTASSYKVNGFDSLDELLESEVDVIDICTPTSTHFDISLKALQAQHNVLVEKPMALSSSEALRLIEEAHRRNLKLGVTQHYIYSRGVLKTRKLIEERAIGDPLHFEISYYLNTAQAPVDWTSKASEGGPLWELGIHPSYVLASFLGEPDEVNATGTYSLHSKHSSVHVSVEKGSITGAIRMSPTPMEPFSLTVAGTDGYIYLDLMTDAVVKYSRLQRIRWLGRHPWVQGSVKLSLNQFRRSVATSTGAIWRGARYLVIGTNEFSQYRLFKAFIEHVKDGGAFYSTGETGLYALLLVEATAKALGVSSPKAADFEISRKD